MKTSYGVSTWDWDAVATEEKFKRNMALLELYDNADKVKLTCPKCNTTFTNIQRNTENYPYRYCPNCKSVYDMEGDNNSIEYIWYNKDREVIQTVRHTMLCNWNE